MQKVTIVRPDNNWTPLSDESYKSFRYEAELINVVRLDGKWVGIVAWCDGTGITEVDMTEVEEWYEFDSVTAYRQGW